MFSCESIDEIKSNDKISLVCVKDNDTLYLRFKNNSEKTIYIPNYNVDYTDNDDTLYLETIHKQEYNTTTYYRYSNLFPFELFTSQKIEGIIPDSIETYKKQIYFFNQFRLQPLVSLEPDSIYITTLNFINAPKYKTTAKAVFYYKPFLTPERLKRIDYLFDDVVKFDSANANHIVAPIIIRYR